MIGRTILHARRHAVAYVALACSMLALAGASYASIRIGTNEIRNGAVTESKLHNKTIDPVKWNPAYVTAFIRRWANIDPTGKLLAGSPNGNSLAQHNPGTYLVTFGDAFASFCAPIVTVQSVNGASGFANANIETQTNAPTLVFVHTYNAQGQPTPEPFSLAIVCPRGAGSGQTFPYTLP